MALDLTLPGSIPGLLRRGSPIIGALGRRGVVVEDRDCYSLCCWLEPGADDKALPAEGAPREPRELKLGAEVRVITDWRLVLDLTDATGRAHAAWWLAHDHPGEPESVPPWACGFVRPFAWCPIGAMGTTLAGWSPAGERLDRENPVRPEWASGSARGVCDALAALDPDDPRQLDDGSRWVDAEALRLVCLHVAGLAVPRG